MTPRRRVLLHPLALLGALASPIALVLLFAARPPLPPLPSSLSSPVTLALVRGVLELAAWGAAVALVALLLVHSLRALFARRTQPWRPSRLHRFVRPPRQRSLGQARLAAGSARAEFPPPFPLVLRSRPEPSALPQKPPSRVDEPGPAAAPNSPGQELPEPSVSLLGPLTITALQPRRKGLRSQTRELVAYLALHPEGGTAEELVAALWPDVEDGEARSRVWRSVSDARSYLGESIARRDERYLLDRQAVAVDLDWFESTLSRSDAEHVDREQRLEQALALVRGEPLAGSDYPWAAGDIRRLRATIAHLLEELGNVRHGKGDPMGALAAAEQAIALDPHNEAAHRLALEVEAALGLRQAVVDRYEGLCRELDARFGLEPERETRLLYRRLLSQDARAIPGQTS